MMLYLSSFLPHILLFYLKNIALNANPTVIENVFIVSKFAVCTLSLQCYAQVFLYTKI